MRFVRKSLFKMKNQLLSFSSLLLLLLFACKEDEGINPESCENSKVLFDRLWTPEGYGEEGNTLVQIEIKSDGRYFADGEFIDNYRIEDCTMYIGSKFGDIELEIKKLTSDKLVLKNPFTTITYH